MRVEATKIPGCYVITPLVRADQRGRFVKTFHQDIFAEHHLASHFAEEYYSVSQRAVLRGLHFQVPPKDHTKIVYPISGEVFDVVLDLRVGSPTFGQFETFNLSADCATMLYLSPGMAHGFYALSQEAVLMYKVTSVYSQEHDSGIRWNSVGIPWPDVNPVLSPRDQEFVCFQDFKSPFVFKGHEHDE